MDTEWFVIATSEEKAAVNVDASDRLFRANPPAPSGVVLDQAPNYVYAPTVKGSYYLQLTPQAHKTLFKELDTALKFVSVSFLKALFDNSVPLDKTKEMYELDNLFLINDEEEFIKNRDWESNWSAENIPDNSPIRSILTAKEQAKLFVRKTDGRVGEVSLKNELKKIDHIAEMKKSWAQVLNELWPRPSSGTSSKPPRYTKFKLSKNMMIYIEDAGWSRFKPQTVPPAQPITDEQAKAQTEALIQSFINKINDASNKAYTLELAKTWPTQKNDYRRMSTSPFGLYSTYIHMDDWDEYMRKLAEIGDPPIRRFVKQPSDKMNVVQSSYATRAQATFNLIDQLLNEAKLGKSNEWSTSLTKAIQRLDANTDHFTRLPKSGFVRWGELSAVKIKNAVGKRKQEDNQNAVMGESAPVVAQSIGWKWEQVLNKYERQMANHLYIAEWLHLSAFSWGGFLDSNNINQGATSQVPENLVLGTSETNSFMTRYEYAWQELFKSEQAIRDAPTGTREQVTGDLDIGCNLRDVPIRYDTIENNKYTWATIDSIDEEVTIEQGTSAQKYSITTKEIRAIVEKYPFIAYTINYDVSLRGYSYILRQNNPKCETVFYPFMRPFFHVAEKKLDDLLFEEMRKLALLQPKPQ